MKKTFVQSSTAIGSFLMAIGASACCIIPFTLFSITKNLTFSGQKKLADIPKKIANRLAKTLKKIMPLKF